MEGRVITVGFFDGAMAVLIWTLSADGCKIIGNEEGQMNGERRRFYRRGCYGRQGGHRVEAGRRMAMTSELVLYTNPMSRGRIVRWMLEEVGVEYRTRLLDYGPMMKSAEYLAINPMGKVPAIRHGDTVVTEVAAICAYLADVFPAAGLAPPLAHRGAYYRWLFFAAGPLDAAVTNRALDFAPPADKEATVGYGNFSSVMRTLETAVDGEGYVAGATFTAADVYVGSHIGWGLRFGTIDRRPAFETYWSRLSAREAYRHASALDDTPARSAAESGRS